MALASFQGRRGSGTIRGKESVQAEETNYETEASSRLRNAPSIGHMIEELRRLERQDSEDRQSGWFRATFRNR